MVEQRYARPIIKNVKALRNVFVVIDSALSGLFMDRVKFNQPSTTRHKYDVITQDHSSSQRIQASLIIKASLILPALVAITRFLPALLLTQLANTASIFNDSFPVIIINNKFLLADILILPVPPREKLRPYHRRPPSWAMPKPKMAQSNSIICDSVLTMMFKSFRRPIAQLGPLRSFMHCSSLTGRRMLIR